MVVRGTNVSLLEAGWDAVVNGIFLISFSGSLLLVCKNTTDFCLLTLLRFCYIFFCCLGLYLSSLSKKPLPNPSS